MKMFDSVFAAHKFRILTRLRRTVYSAVWLKYLNCGTGRSLEAKSHDKISI